jgi:16S rRNA (guanine1207-N2)-methyltransferase
MNQYFVCDGMKHEIRYIPYEFKGERFTFATHNGVFSKNHVDHATDILLNTVPPLSEGSTLLDMGCGYGVIGIVLAKIYGLKLTAVDVNPAAVELTRRNGAADVRVSDCFGCFGAVADKFDTIVINPPIHAGKAVTYEMYSQSPDFLNDGGRLYVVTFKKHGAESTISKLTEVFGNCKTIYKKKGIYVLECQAAGFEYIKGAAL